MALQLKSELFLISMQKLCMGKAHIKKEKKFEAEIQNHPMRYLKQAPSMWNEQSL